MSYKTITAAALIAFGAFAANAPIASADPMATVKAVDTDSDGTISMDEAKKAAMTKFSMMDTDKEGTVDSKEAGMDVSSVDPDKDGTLDKTEYASAVEAAFKKADPDGDGTVDAKELATPAGESLSMMLAK